MQRMCLETCIQSYSAQVLYSLHGRCIFGINIFLCILFYSSVFLLGDFIFPYVEDMFSIALLGHSHIRAFELFFIFFLRYFWLLNIYFCLTREFKLIWRPHHYQFFGHLQPLSSEGSLACHTHCYTGHMFIMVIPENPWNSHLLPSVWQWRCYYLFYGLWLSRLGFYHPTYRVRGERSNRCATAAARFL